MIIIAADYKILSLDGNWEFAYQKGMPDVNQVVFPRERDFEVLMRVPGYWDDSLDRIRYSKFWSRGVDLNLGRKIETFPLGADKPADASLPYIIGTGWYRKTIRIDDIWHESAAVLHIGGAHMETWVWLNGEFIGYHLGHLTPFEMELGDKLRFGEDNQLLIAVANTRNDCTGCNIRGYKGKSGGINRSVYLKLHKAARIKDCYIRSDEKMQELLWEVELNKHHKDRDLTVKYEIIDPLTDEIIIGDTFTSKDEFLRWKSPAKGLKSWSDIKPNLYNILVVVSSGGRVLDKLAQPFGLRYVSTKGSQIRLNGRAVFLRGLTEHAYFPESCTTPTDISYYMNAIKKLKSVGFNHIRFHTWTPPEECMIAADKLGMLLQVEAPNGFKDSEWLDILKTCRKHPSVVIYCCGNEVRLSDTTIDRLGLMAEHCNDLVPDALFNPMDGMRHIEYDIDKNDPGYVEKPYPLNLRLLNRLKPFSDVFSPHGAIFSGHAIKTDMTTIENRLAEYEKPCLMHELGIRDSYINLDLEHRYENTRIGSDLYSSARSYLKEMGLLAKAPLYYEKSCLWMQQIIKYSIELARRSHYISGYDLLGAIDCHWHRSGYGVGMFNEFYQLKPGYIAENVQRYNGANVLLADVGTYRNLWAHDEFALPVYISLFGDKKITDGILEWRLINDDNMVYAFDKIEVKNIGCGEITKLADVRFKVPALKEAKHVRLELCLSDAKNYVKNSWDYWIFPRCTMVDQDTFQIVERLNAETVEYIENGGRVLLLGAEPFPNCKTTFQIMSGGRTQGNSATVVYDHPVTRDFPHDGFCDWQFFSMMEEADTVVFNDLDIPFDPIVEMVSTYKLIRKQASLFELKIGEGGLVVCSLNLNPKDPGAMYFKNNLVRYLKSPEFAPKNEVSAKFLMEQLHNSGMLNIDFSTDEGYDDGGHAPGEIPMEKAVNTN